MIKSSNFESYLRSLRIVLLATVVFGFGQPIYANSCLNQFLPTPKFPKNITTNSDAQLSDDLESISQKVLHSVGLARRVRVFGDVPISNACAAISGDGKNRRLVYVNSDWLDDVSGGDYWIKVGIIAHEIGHHANSHTFENDLNAWQRELEADTFAGRVIAVMGGSIDQALAMLTVLPASATNSHPNAAYRTLAITKGYSEGPQIRDVKPSSTIQLSGGGTPPDSIFIESSATIDGLNVGSTLEFSSKLLERPLLKLEDAVIDLSNPKYSGKTLFLNTLEMVNSEIVLGENKITLAAAKVLIQNSSIRSGFDTSGKGLGRDSGSLVLLATEAVKLDAFEVVLSGEVGADGSVGLKGADGAPGAQGVSGQTETIMVPEFRGLKITTKPHVVCTVQPTPGRNGAPGRAGGQGTSGRDGGIGGDFTMILLSDAAHSVSLDQKDFKIFLDGGHGGNGGPGGPGGRGGAGGPPGAAPTGCSSAPAGSDGRNGEPGLAGRAGNEGAIGTHYFSFMTPEEAYAKLK